MEQFIIEGPTSLSGEVQISGSKNAALPIIAASLLIRDEVILNNVPLINDVITLLKIIKQLGGEYQINKNTVTINTKNLIDTNPDPIAVKHLRASILLLGPLLFINKHVTIPHPGGCLIGTRPFDIHLKSFEKMGALVTETKDSYTIKAKKLNPTELIAEFTVTGTENIIMAAVLTPGVTTIKLAAAEPHVQDLCNFLKSSGANIKGIGTHLLKIEGVDSLKPTKFTIQPDQIESGTYAIAAAATNGHVIINGFISDHHDALLSKFQRAGVNYKIINSETLEIFPNKILNSFKIRTEVYPGFPTDLQAPMAVLATQCVGESVIHETIFEGRLGYIPELSKMGARAQTTDVHHAIIKGPSKLIGTRITSFDLRAGATLIIAALIAKGESRIDQVEIIDRGYENIESKLNSLGANIKRVKLKEIEA